MEPRKVVRVHPIDLRTDSLAEKGIYFLDGEIDEAVAQVFYVNLMYSLTKRTGSPMWLYLNSPGGSADQGFAIYDSIMMAREAGSQVNIVGIGLVASVAGVIMQAGTRRFSLPNTQFLVHQVRQTMGFFGSEEVSEARDRTEELERINEIALGILSQRSGLPLDEIKKMCKKTDVWLDPLGAKSFGPNGLIDEIDSCPGPLRSFR